MQKETANSTVGDQDIAFLKYIDKSGATHENKTYSPSKSSIYACLKDTDPTPELINVESKFHNTHHLIKQ